MPEGPELYMASRFINEIGMKHVFGGQVVKSEVSTKNPDVNWNHEIYRIKARTRGKELKMTLVAGKEDMKGEEGLDIIFRFGMSGSFKFTPAMEIPKHAHLQFYTINGAEPMVLSFVDYRRFGRWEMGGSWGKDRGPDPMWEYASFRENILANLQASAFNRPICEAMLNQKFFNGIGNYLRAEILYRCGVRPFDEAREVLSELKQLSKWYDTFGEAQNHSIKQEDQDVKTEVSDTKTSCAIKLESQNIKLEGQDIKLYQDIKQEGQNIKTEGQYIKLKNQNSKLESQDIKLDQDKKLEVQDIKLEDQDIKAECQTIKHEDQDIKVNGVTKTCVLVKPDLLDLCHLVPQEVIALSGGGKGYNFDLESDGDEYQEFRAWLQCYNQDGMNNLVDHNKRTIWFAGHPGKLIPIDSKSRGQVERKTKSQKPKNSPKEKDDSKSKYFANVEEQSIKRAKTKRMSKEILAASVEEESIKKKKTSEEATSKYFVVVDLETSTKREPRAKQPKSEEKAKPKAKMSDSVKSKALNKPQAKKMSVARTNTTSKAQNKQSKKMSVSSESRRVGVVSGRRRSSRLSSADSITNVL